MKEWFLVASAVAAGVFVAGGILTLLIFAR